MIKANVDIRKEAKSAKIPLWQIALKLGISEVTLVRRLRLELAEQQKKEIFSIICELKAGEIYAKV